MSKTIYLIAFCAFLITACSAQTPIESPPDSYPAPQQTEPVQASEPQENTDDSVYPPPFHTAIPVVNLGTSYPAPEGGMEVFVIVPGESGVSYEVGEVFLNQNNAFNLAVGVTSEVTDEILVDRENPQNSSIGPIRVDISQFTSDNQRRDNTIRERFLESAKFPIVEFTPGEILGLSESYQEGQEIAFQVSGDLTVRNQCPQCNRFERGGGIEFFRDALMEQTKTALRDSVNYRFALKYKQIEETPKPIVFYFETLADEEPKEETQPPIADRC